MRTYDRGSFHMNGSVSSIQFVDSEKLVHSKLKSFGYTQD